ncbi:MAG: hypothetical protein R3282_01675 [Rhodothermales bacterium]|nr:hypothetical protein [Rhodothermales bacterium]
MVIETRILSFAVAGSITLAHEIVGTLIASIPDADGSTVAEETLALLSVVSARAVTAAAGDHRAGPAVSESLLDLPAVYYDYLLGGAVLTSAEGETDTSVYERLLRKQQFYAVHFPHGERPSKRLLKDKMELWMGRLSPPGLPEHPAARLERLDLVEAVALHAQLVYEFASRLCSGTSTPAAQS